jgi:hypothetical protein
MLLGTWGEHVNEFQIKIRTIKDLFLKLKSLVGIHLLALSPRNNSDVMSSSNQRRKPSRLNRNLNQLQARQKESWLEEEVLWVVDENGVNGGVRR